MKKFLAGLLALACTAAAHGANIAPSVSITAPAAAANFVAPTAVTLSADATDTDGTIANVAFYNGATLLATVSAAPYTYRWTNVAAGSYSITAKATDDLGAVTTSATRTVTVKTNVPPSVSLTSPTATGNYIGPTTINFSVNASDSDGRIVRVDYYNGTALIGSATVAPFSSSLANVPPGSYSVTAKATDDKSGTTTSAPVSVFVKTNVAPTVSMTATPSSIYAPGTVTLSASAADSDGTVTKVQFFNGAALIGSDTTAPYAFAWTSATPGSYSMTARATDSNGAVTSSGAVVVVVKAPPAPVVNITSPQANARFVAPAAFAVTASATITGDTISKVEYYSAGTLIGTATTAPYTINLNNVAAANYNVSAKATGALGGTATSAALELVVSNNAAPSITLSATPSSAAAPADVTLNATATDNDGTVAKVEFFNGPTLLATDTAAPYTYTWSGLAAGTYTIIARATDDRNVVATSDAVTLSVTAPGAGDTEVFFIEGDQVNSPREISNQAGTQVWLADSDAFATNLPDENPAGIGVFTYNQRFPGQYFDRETGLHQNFYRDYDPQTGRYVQSDPIGLAGGSNTYSYVGSDPLSEIDPLGLFGWRDAAAFVPVLGSGLDAYSAYQCGNMLRAGFNAGLAITEATGAGALVKGLTVGTMNWSARHEIRQIYRASSNWDVMRRRLQKIGEVKINSHAIDRGDWMTTDHIFIKQRYKLPHDLTDHPANLQINVTQRMNTAFENMHPLDRAKYLPPWMKLSAAGTAAYLAGLFVGPGASCGCE